MEDKKNEIEHFKFDIKWVDGRPVPTYTKMITKEAVSQLPLTVLSLPYRRTALEIELGIDEEYEGKTNGEVALMRLAAEAARGNLKAVDMLMDRVTGKPKITTENKNITLTYEDLLDQIARNEDKEPDVDDL